MTPATAISILLLILFAACWVMYLLEAFEQDPGQALLTLLVPFYLFYFAFIRSVKSTALRLSMTAFLCAFLGVKLVQAMSG